MFILSLTYQKSLEEVDTHLKAHVAFLETYYSQGIFLASGRKVPRDGGIILALAPSREALEAIIACDPFCTHGIAHYDITEFIPTMSSPELAFLTQH